MLMLVGISGWIRVSMDNCNTMIVVVSGPQSLQTLNNITKNHPLLKALAHVDGMTPLAFLSTMRGARYNEIQSGNYEYRSVPYMCSFTLFLPLTRCGRFQLWSYHSVGMG